jgi:hypothetical protein
VRSRLTLREVAEHHPIKPRGPVNDGLADADRGVAGNAVLVVKKMSLPAAGAQRTPRESALFRKSSRHRHSIGTENRVVRV